MKNFAVLSPNDQAVIRHALEVVKDMINEDLEHLSQVKHIRTTYNNIINNLETQGTGIVGQVNIITEIIKRCQDHVNNIDEILNGNSAIYEKGHILGDEYYYRDLICPKCDGNKFKRQDTPHPNNTDDTRRCLKCNSIWKIDIVESRINFTELSIVGLYDKE